MAQLKTTIEVHVQPGAGTSQVVGFEDKVLRVKVAAPPRKGQANRSLVAFFAKLLDVPKGDVEVIRGHTGRRKVIAVRGLDSERVRRRLIQAASMK